MTRIRLVFALAVLLATPAAASAHEATGTLSCQGAELQLRGFPAGADNTIDYKLTVDGVEQRKAALTLPGAAGTLTIGFDLRDTVVHTVVVSAWWDTNGARAGSEAHPAFSLSRSLSCSAQSTPTSPGTPPAGTGTGGQPPGGAPAAPGPSPAPPATTPTAPVTGQGPGAPCPACPPTASGSGGPACPVCVSRRVLTIRLLESTGHRLRSATVQMRGRTFRARRRARDGRMVVRLDFRGLRGPNVMAARISAVERDGDRVRATRLFRICKRRDGVTVNFEPTRL